MQNSWQEHILREFVPQVNRLTLVADPDYLVTEEDILQRLRERGFDILLLADIFPNLSYAVIKSLDRGNIEPLYRAYLRYKSGKLGDNATKDFLLSRVFDLDAEVIQQPSDLLRILLRRHYRDQPIPKMLDQRFIQILHQYGRFEDWPLETIIEDRESFFSFLQERWTIFLKQITTNKGSSIHESPTTYALKYSGPPDIPFDHEDVRVYIDTLFLDGLLQPVAYPVASNPSQQWITVGVRLNPEADRMRRLEGLIRSIGTAIPTDDARYQDWFTFAHRWSELLVLWHETHVQQQSTIVQQFDSVQKKVDTTFQAWIMKRYSSLHNLPSTPPVMVHHIAHDLAQCIQTTAKEKVALIILDGLAFDQWIARKLPPAACP